MNNPYRRAILSCRERLAMLLACSCVLFSLNACSTISTQTFFSPTLDEGQWIPDTVQHPWTKSYHLGDFFVGVEPGIPMLFDQKSPPGQAITMGPLFVPVIPTLFLLFPSIGVRGDSVSMWIDIWSNNDSDAVAIRSVILHTDAGGDIPGLSKRTWELSGANGFHYEIQFPLSCRDAYDGLDSFTLFVSVARRGNVTLPPLRLRFARETRHTYYPFLMAS